MSGFLRMLHGAQRLATNNAVPVPEHGNPRNPKQETSEMVVMPEKPPNYVDWRRLGVVTAVRYQGLCGSCWAHAPIVTVEAKIKIIKGGELKTLSVQELVDGDLNSKGCTSGTAPSAFTYIMKKGLCLESEYPYLFQKSAKLSENIATMDAKNKTKIDGFVKLRLKGDDGDVSRLLEAVSRQPICLSLKTGKLFDEYKATDGYFKGEPSVKKEHEVFHGLCAVASGLMEDGNPYLLLKNSWGLLWGEFGFIKLALNQDTMKNIIDPYFPILHGEDLSAYKDSDIIIDDPMQAEMFRINSLPKTASAGCAKFFGDVIFNPSHG